jgi:hypothetical protein
MELYQPYIPSSDRERRKSRRKRKLPESSFRYNNFVWPQAPQISHPRDEHTNKPAIERSRNRHTSDRQF